VNPRSNVRVTGQGRENVALQGADIGRGRRLRTRLGRERRRERERRGDEDESKSRWEARYGVILARLA